MYRHAIGIMAILLYLTASAVLARRLLAGNDESVKLRVIGTGLVAVVLHAVALYPVLVTAAGLNLGFFNAASLVGLLMALMLLVTSINHPLENLGIIVLPLAALVVALMFAYPTREMFIEDYAWQLDVHILLSVLAYSLLAIAVVQAIVLASQEHILRSRHPGKLIRSLPPLQAMESLLFQMIGIGFVLLSMALLSGMLFLEDIFAQHLVHKTVLSIVAWVVFGVLLWGRWRFGWRGSVAIRWTIGGFLFLMLAYFGSKLVLELILKR